MTSLDIESPSSSDSDHEPSVGLGRGGMEEQGFAAQSKAGNTHPGDEAAAPCARQHRSSRVHGVLVRSPNTSIGARVLCMTLAEVSCEPHARLVVAARPLSYCCSVRWASFRLIRRMLVRHAETRSVARMRPAALALQE